MKKIIIAALAAVMILSTAACSSTETANSITAAESAATESTAADTAETEAETVDTVEIEAETENTAAASEAPTASTSLTGSWEHELGYTYIFREDKTGEYVDDSTGEAYWVFTYETEGNRLTMYNEDGSVLMETEYKIDGDTLMIMDSFGTKVYYTFKS